LYSSRRLSVIGFGLLPASTMSVPVTVLLCTIGLHMRHVVCTHCQWDSNQFMLWRRVMVGFRSGLKTEAWTLRTHQAMSARG